MKDEQTVWLSRFFFVTQNIFLKPEDQLKAMNKKIKNALETFTLLLPEYFPEKLGNPFDLNRWMDVCYQSCIVDERLSEEDVVNALAQRFPKFDFGEISAKAKNYMDEYCNYMLLLDYLKSNDRLK